MNEIDISKLPIIKDPKFAFISDWYDAPLNGHLWWEGKYCYFDLHDWLDDHNRLYLVYELVGDQLIYELAGRQMWTAIMGNGRITKGANKDQGAPDHAAWMEHWDKLFPSVDKTKLTPIAVCYLFNKE